MRLVLKAAILSVLACAVPQAALGAEITLSPPSAPPTAQVAIHGTGFSPGAQVQVFGFPLVNEAATADAQGAFTVGFQVPRDAFPGPVLIRASAPSDFAFASFVVSTPWNQAGRVAGRTGFNQFEGILGRDTADDLFVRWRTNVDGGEPIVNHNTVYARTRTGITALQLLCRSPLLSCDEPLVQGRFAIPGPVFFTSTPIIGKNRLYVAANFRVYAFSTTCKTAGSCDPIWSRGFNPEPRSLTFAHGMLYVGTNDSLRGFDVAACEAAAGACKPVSTVAAPDPAGARAGVPAIANGRIAVVGGILGELMVFDEACRGRCAPLWHAEVGGAGTPVIAGPHTVVISDGHVRTYRTDCRTDGGVCAPLWTSAGANHTGRPAVAGRRVFAPGERQLPTGAFVSDFRAYELDCRTDGGQCTNAWRWTSAGPGFSGDSAPVVANGVVYAPFGTRISMLSTACANPCQPLGFVNVDRSPEIAIADATLVASTLTSLTAFSSNR